LKTVFVFTLQQWVNILAFAVTT